MRISPDKFVKSVGYGADGGEASVYMQSAAKIFFVVVFFPLNATI